MEKTGSLFLALNFEGAEIPKRIELVPPGEVITGRDGRTWKNPNPALAALNSMARLPKLPIDENHATDLAAPKGGSSPALGWMTNLNADGSGAIYADVEWTPRGKEAVRNKEYGYISPVFLYNKENEINCILRAGLTNSPNLGLPALNAEQKNNDMEESMDKALCAALGIAETAAVNDALAAIEKLKTARNAADGGSVDLGVYAPRAELNAALEKAVAAEKRLAELNAAAFRKEAEAAVDEAVKAGKFPPASRETCLALCADKTGLEKFKALAASSPAIVDGKVQVPETAPPAGGAALNSEDAALAKAMGYSEEEYRKIKEAGSKA